jgi:DNA repair protein RecO (recombination protein O)
MALWEKTQGVILLRKNYRSSSKIIDFYSLNYGRLLLLAKGVRNMKNIYSGVLEPLNYCEIVFYQRENQLINFVKDATLLKTFLKITQDYQKYIKILNLNKFLTFILPLGEKNEEIFKLYLQTLSLSSNYPLKYIQGIIISFYLKTVSLSGFQPSLFKCLKCEDWIFKKKKVYFNLSAGGVLCAECSQNEKDSFLIVKKILENLQGLLILSFNKLLNYQVFSETTKLVNWYLSYYFKESLTL